MMNSTRIKVHMSLDPQKLGCLGVVSYKGLQVHSIMTLGDSIAICEYLILTIFVMRIFACQYFQY